jgi:hypothetical protein
MVYHPLRTPPDTFAGRSTELDGPSRFAFEITPSATDLDYVTRGVYVGISGNVYCRPAGYANNIAGSYSSHGGTSGHANVFFMNVVAGTILPLRLDKIWATNDVNAAENTTADKLVGLY